ncbi:hypothetical protein [Mycobacterium sp. IDR2000157661]|nr:hypothetical protein [Mycobacterium sp. IDR2000157661]ULE32299.1 hypothetical protein K3G64_19510 [Mycobacterium sp. IDR2000157661]
MSIETTLRMVMIGLVVFVIVVSFALDENSYGGRRRAGPDGGPEATN